MLYQLSYFRISYNRFPDCECKGNTFSETPKIREHFLQYFFQKIDFSLSFSPRFYLENDKKSSIKIFIIKHIHRKL